MLLFSRDDFTEKWTGTLLLAGQPHGVSLEWTRKMWFGFISISRRFNKRNFDSNLGFYVILVMASKSHYHFSDCVVFVCMGTFVRGLCEWEAGESPCGDRRNP